MILRGPAPAGDISSTANFDPSSIGPSGYLPASNGYPGFASASTQLAPLIDDLLAHGRQGLNTLKGVASTWAPAGGARNTGDYANSLALRTGVKPTQPIDMGHPGTVAKLANAVIWNQIGHNPFGASEIDQAVQDRLALRQALPAQQDQRAAPGTVAPAPAGSTPLATPTPTNGVPSPDAMAPSSATGPGTKQDHQLPTGSVDGLPAGKSMVNGGKAAAEQPDGDWNHLGGMTLTGAEEGIGALTAMPGDVTRALTHTSPQAAQIYARLGPGARARATATDNMPFISALRQLPTGEEMAAGIAKALGNTPYHAHSLGGRLFQQGVSGAVSGAPFGLVGAAAGAVSGAASQGAQELGLPPWAQTAVGIAAPLLAHQVGPAVREAGARVAPSIKSTLQDFAADESGGGPRRPKAPPATGGAGNEIDKDTVRVQPYGGPGGGHHLLAKSAFRGAKGNDTNAMLAIPNDELARFKIYHPDISGAQQKGYRAFARKEIPLSLDGAGEIDGQALIDAGLAPKAARNAMQQAVAWARARGIKPTRIPWGEK